jgi:DNA-binding beta-propeller fold protein YncE
LLALAGGAARDGIDLSGLPSGVVAGEAGLFVSTEGPYSVGDTVVALRRDGDGFRQSGRAEIEAGANAVALTPDHNALLVATRVGIAALDARGLARGDAVKVDAVRDGPAPGTKNIVATVDGHYALFANQRDATLGIARIDDSDASAPALHIVGHVSLDRLPGGMALTRDGTTLYVTSEIDNVDPHDVPGAADPRLGRQRCPSLGPNGVLSVIDVRRAIDDPKHAVVARVAAGCAPVRVALSPNEDVAWVSVQGESRVLGFSTAVLRVDAAHALRAEVHVGAIPVGLAESLDGRTLLVANSHRPADADDPSTGSLTAIDPQAALAGKPSLRTTIDADALPREIVAQPDGSFLVTEYRARRIVVVTPADIARGR